MCSSANSENMLPFKNPTGTDFIAKFLPLVFIRQKAQKNRLCLKMPQLGWQDEDGKLSLQCKS